MPDSLPASNAQPPTAPAETGRGNGGWLRRFARLAGPFFTGAAGRGPILLGLLVLALTLVQVAIQIRINIWNRDFFNALETRDRTGFLYQIGIFLVWAAASMAAWVVALGPQLVVM